MRLLERFQAWRAESRRRQAERDLRECCRQLGVCYVCGGLEEWNYAGEHCPTCRARADVVRAIAQREVQRELMIARGTKT